jgi:hypothetical protein
MTTQKLKVYENIICLEMETPESAGWWYMGGSLVYTPVHIDDVKKVRYVILEGTRKPLLVVVTKIGGLERMAAINLPRSDTKALQRKGFWHERIKDPYEEITYSPTPQRKTYRP